MVWGALVYKDTKLSGRVKSDFVIVCPGRIADSFSVDEIILVHFLYLLISTSCVIMDIATVFADFSDAQKAVGESRRIKVESTPPHSSRF
jgi:hypothetical protein